MATYSSLKYDFSIPSASKGALILLKTVTYWFLKIDDARITKL